MRAPRMNRTGAALLSLAFVFLLGFVPHAFAFSNDQAATLVIGEATLTSFSPSASQNALVAPVGLAIDSSGNLWVVDQGANRVLEYKAPLSTHEAASVVIGQTSFTSLTSGTTATTFMAPQGIAFDKSGNLWVADSGNNRVLEFNAPFTNGEAASVVIGQSNFTGSGSATTATGLNQPEAIAFDSSGNLWVADALNSRVLEYPAPLSTGEAATLVLGEKNFVTAIDEVSKAGMSTPSGLAFDSSGNLWVVDGIRALEYTAPFTTHESASIVIGQNTFTNSSTVATATGLDMPWAVALDKSGNLWVGDYGDNRVLMYPAPLTTGEAATLVLGQQNFTGSASNPVLSPTATSLNHPYGMVFDSSGDILVSDYAEGRVLGYGSGFSAAATSASSSTSTQTTSSVVSTTSTVAPVTTSSAVTPTSTGTTSSSASSSSGGGVPVFPYQTVTAVIFTVVLAASYLLLRRGSLRGRPSHRPATR